jgi:predicted DNA-binding protein
MGRNTSFLKEIVEALGDEINDKALALQRLEDHFKDRYVLDAGNVGDVADFATSLRLDINDEERDNVLDYIAENAMAGISLDIVEDAINGKFPGRFIEP